MFLALWADKQRESLPFLLIGSTGLMQMKRVLIACTLAWATGCFAFAASTAPLTDLHVIHALSNAAAAHHAPVAVQATVTYYRRYTRELFIQQDGVAIYVFLTKDFDLKAGDRVRVKGILQPSFHPIIQSDDITVLSHGPLPAPKPTNYYDLAHSLHDGEFVRVDALVRAADLITSHGVRSTYLHLLADGGAIDASVENDDPAPLKDLLDAEVEVTGVAAARFDSKMQQTGIMIHLNSVAAIQVVKRAGVDPWALPATPMDQIFSGYEVRDLTTRLRVHGTLTYYQPGAALVLQDGRRALWLTTSLNTPLTIGHVVDAIGFPDVHDGFLNLKHAAVRDTGVSAPVTPQPETWQSLSSSDNIIKGHIYELVSIEGQVVTEAREAAQDEYVLYSNGRLFTAIYHHSDKATLIPLPVMKDIPIGARVRVNGICVQLSSNPWNGPVPFNILLRDFDDITVIARPSPLNVRNLSVIAGFLLLVVIVVAGWGWALKAKVRSQTSKLATMADFEHSRSRTLEDINGTRPLNEILVDITSIVSARLNGAPCWCVLGNGQPVGAAPASSAGLQTLRADISSRDGAASGFLCAAISELSEAKSAQQLALTEGARLAALAVETRRHYSDLRHRSEYDLLTGTHNRFSFDRHLREALIQAGASASFMGLVYIDLDDFKQVNDAHGHHIGDLFLKESVLRMKHQLRSFDILGRLGGDEFAALLPVVHSRADIAEVAHRLERCFDEPFVLEGYTLHGSASVGIALCPEDGENADALLTVADASMYAAKFAKRKLEALASRS